MSNVLRELNSNVLKLKQLLRQQQKDVPQIQRLTLNLEKSLDELWSEQNCTKNFQTGINSAELIRLLTSGRITSTLALADDVLRFGQASWTTSWAGDGQSYARWLGRGFLILAKLSASAQVESLFSVAQSLLSHAMSFGYPDILVETIIFDEQGFVNSSDMDLDSLLPDLIKPTARRFVVSLLNVLQRKLRDNGTVNAESQISDASYSLKVAETAALLRPIFLTTLDQDDMEYVFSLILRVSAGCPQLLRAVVVSMTDAQQEFLLERSWQAFSDPLSIDHFSLVQQTTLSQLLCLSLGRVYHRENMRVFLLARSSMHTKGISTRLKSPLPRVRLLGMSIAVIVSRLVDKVENRIAFEFVEEENRTLDEFQSLVDSNDYVASSHGIHRNLSTTPEQPKSLPDQSLRHENDNTVEVKSSIRTKFDEAEGEDDDQDLQIVDRPEHEAIDDGNGVDSGTRAPSKAPVYIRDLIQGLQNPEDYARFKQSISEASVLIRRKAGFGFELKDQCQDLAAALLAIRSPFEIEGLDEYQRQAITALIVAETEVIGPYYCHTYFFGDYNTRQKVLVLESVALAAQALAGRPQGILSDPSTTRLPPRLHLSYHSSKAISGKEGSNSGQRHSSVTGLPHLSDTVANSLFFPLIRHQHLHGKHGSDPSTALLCSTYLNTLATTLSTARYSRLSSHMIHEFWNLLLDLRGGLATSNVILLGSVLTGFATIVEIIKNSTQLAKYLQREISETFDWVNAIYEEGMVSHDIHEQNKTLAAVLLIDLRDIAASNVKILAGN